MTRARPLAAAALLVLTGACAIPPMAPQVAVLDNVQILRAREMPSFSLGNFQPAPDKAADFDHVVYIRASALRAPGDGSFSHYLRQTLEAQLRAAGKLAPAAPMSISAELTRSEVNSFDAKGHGAVAARFRVTSPSGVVYERELTAEDEWDSSIIGAIAIPTAMDRYTALYPKLVSAFLADPDFQQAVRTN